MTDMELFKFFIKLEFKDKRTANYRQLSDLQQHHFGNRYGKCTLIKKLQKSKDLKYMRFRDAGVVLFRIDF